MARTRSFDPEQVLQQAVMLFWQQGFERLSMEQLVKHLGVNRYSLYETFGNKQALFELSLERYIAVVFEFMQMPLKEHKGKAALTAFCQKFRDQLQRTNANNGCLMFNSLQAKTPMSDTALQNLHTAIEKQQTLLLQRIIEAQTANEFKRQFKPEAAAQFIAAQTRLLLNTRRDQGIEAMTTIADFLIADIEAW